MNAQLATLPNLRRLIGQCVSYHGICCRVFEVLDDGPSLVLIDSEQHTAVQDNQYGEPNRVVPRTYTVPVLRGAEFHPRFLELSISCCK